MDIRIEPLTAERWADLGVLFGPRGACGGCWCMFWRQTRAQFETRKGAANRRAFRRLVVAGPAPGLLAYAGGEPVGWCALAPRESYARLARSRTLRGPEAQGIWSLTCFFVQRRFRRQGLSVALLKAAGAYAAKQGARLLEGYPVIARKGKLPDVFAYTGLLPAFRKAGFEETARPSPSRAIVRLRLR